ncbi:PhoX family protein [Sphingomonas sp. GB1N7]|uniref:PhoX family protein n=1 Tax=Parasphingomonas caseinilytica TaxID=3096158 RepID=UPI002FCAA644
MTTVTDLSIAYDDGDIDTNRTANPHLNDLIGVRYSRRQTLFGGISAAATAVFGGALLSACGSDNVEPAPVVSAGSAVTTSAGRLVTLVATVSGTTTNAVWTQVSGPAVTLAVIDKTTVTFTAPAVTASTPLVFRFTAVGSGGAGANADTTVTVTPAVLGFTAVAKNRDDIVTVPAGYSVTVLYRLGDPMLSGVGAYANDGSDTTFSRRAGDHHDGMTYFGLSATGNAPDPTSSTRGLLVMNHENITQVYLHPNGPTTVGGARPEGEALKEMECHGVSVIEINRATTWSYAPTGALNRRITPLTPMAFSGPAKGATQLKTRFSTDGSAGRGTINNCANGTMPWNTYLTAEENWAGYFRRTAGDAAVRTAAGAAKENASLTRYGISEGRTGNYGWSTVSPADTSSTIYARWNATANATAPADGSGDFRHEPFQYGWIVEIDPFDAASTPRKRTALGRMNHEGCVIGRTIAGVKPAFYMGDDAQNEYLYKFVSSATWSAADATNANRLAMGDKYLDAGTLYVARLNSDGTGTWMPLVFGTGPLTSANATYAFADQADVLINTRLAADALGATRMDRPEWTAVNPTTGEVYLTLTNNSSRTVANTDWANPRAYVDQRNAATNPTVTAASITGNPNGHVIRLRETGDSSEALSFTWDIYAFGAGADLDPVNINLSGLDATNDFSSPDGLWFGLPSNVTGNASPLMWIQTDDSAYTDVTNCMMLAAIPGVVGDGGVKTITNTIGTTSGTQGTRVGKAPGTTLRRFLVGPKECEITGIFSTPDGKSVFVNIQHPGENGTAAAISSSWPASQAGTPATPVRPRSATIVITRTDGGIVGL